MIRHAQPQIETQPRRWSALRVCEQVSFEQRGSDLSMAEGFRERPSHGLQFGTGLVAGDQLASNYEASERGSLIRQMLPHPT